MLDQESAIVSARTLYDKGNYDVKDGVTNYEVLERAEIELSNLKVQNVINLFSLIYSIRSEMFSMVTFIVYILF